MIYMDNAATTKLSEPVKNEIIRVMDIFGNPSSLHRMGLDAEKIVEASRDIISKKIGGEAKNLFFTSGGTEANNLAIIGKARALKRRGNHVVTTKIEHPSVIESVKALEREGFLVDFVPCMPDGRIDTDALENILREDTVLVSVMHANNETGVIQPISEIKQIVKKKSPLAKLHVDAVQSFCKIDFNVSDIDMLSISAHKIHGPKGVGALYIKDGKVSPIINGGEQQGKIRPGTENVLGIAAFSEAVKTSRFDFKKAYELRMYFKDRLLESIVNIKIHGCDEFSSGSVLNVSFIGVKAEILLHAFEAKGLFVSTGSACSSHKPQPSHVLTAMGLSKKEIEGAVRFSFDEDLTKEEIDAAVEIIKTEVASIRR